MTGGNDLFTRVSYHAVTRCVQRIMGVTLPVAANPRVTADRHCAAIGLSIDDVRAAILSPAVVLAIRWGAHQVRCPEFTILLDQKDGEHVVTTVVLGSQRSAAAYRPPEDWIQHHGNRQRMPRRARAVLAAQLRDEAAP